MGAKVNQLKVGAILSYVSRFITVVVGLLYTPIMIRLLGQNEYGLYSIAVSTIAYLGLLNFGFGSAYMRFYSRYKVARDDEKIARLNSMFLAIFSVLGVLAVIAGIILAFNVDIIFGTTLSNQELGITRALILILVVNLSATFPAIVFNTYLQANEKFIIQNVLLIIWQISTPLLSLPILLAGYGSIGMVIVSTSTNILVELLIMMYCLKKMKMKFSFKGFDRDLMVEMTVFSSYIFMSLVVEQVNNNVDKTILGRYQGTIPVAIYSVGSNLNIYYQQLSMTIAQVFTPRIHRMVAANTEDMELTKLFSRVGRLQFILLSLVMTGFIFFGRPFIGLWAGQNYYESYPVAILLMLSGSVPLFQTVGIEIQQAKNMHQFRSWVYLIIALVNIILSIPLAQQFGAVGAALGTAITVIIGNCFIMNWYYHKKVGINMIYFWKEVLKFMPALILPLVYGVFVYQVIDLYHLPNLLLHGFIYLLIFIATAWFIGMNDYEKHLMKHPLK
jgi:O-antigen/teichoic acid export membrane protein